MKSSGMILLATILFMVAAVGNVDAQVVVDEKNLNEQKDLEYIQFMYYIDKSDVRPVYMIDYGMTDDPSKPFKNQKLFINQTEITSLMSPVLVLNKLYSAGWEYIGDGTYVQMPLMENWYSYTLKRKPTRVQAETAASGY